jgi:hypothetical protein
MRFFLVLADIVRVTLISLTGIGLIWYLWRLFRPRRRAPATLLEHRKGPGFPIHWSRNCTATFEVLEQSESPVRVHVKLSWPQAYRWADQWSAGDVGQLTWRGTQMYAWEPASPAAPSRRAGGKKVFVSYAHEWAGTARYLEHFLASQGCEVWRDEARLLPGDRLTRRIRDQIACSDAVMPLLSREFAGSEWCREELGLAAEHGIPVIPVVVGVSDADPPEELRLLLEGELGDPVRLDLGRPHPRRQLDLVIEMLNRLEGAAVGEDLEAGLLRPAPPLQRRSEDGRQDLRHLRAARDRLDELVREVENGSLSDAEFPTRLTRIYQDLGAAAHASTGVGDEEGR